jgi:hypothetical protein
VNTDGLPAEVVTNRMSLATSNSSIAGSRLNNNAMFAPTAPPVSSRTRRRSARPWSEVVSMMPSAPAFDTAAASCAPAM